MLALEFIELEVFGDKGIQKEPINVASIERISADSTNITKIYFTSGNAILVAHNKEWLIEQLEYNHHVTRLKDN